MPAVRITFSYLGDQVSPLEWREVDTVAPLSAPLGSLAGRSGFWCEVRDAGGRPVHRQPLRDPRHPTDEVPGRQRHVPRPDTAGVFTVLVPAGADTVVLLQRRTTDAEPIEVLRLPLVG